MGLYFNKKSLSNEYFLFTVIVLFSVFFLSIGFCCYFYHLYDKEKKNLLLKLTDAISFELVNIFKEDENILRFFGSKITNQTNYTDLNNIANLLISSIDLNIRSMTRSYICWVNPNGKLTVSGKTGILKNNIPDIKDREYFISAKENPWILQISKPSISFFSKSPVLPTAMGIQNKYGKFIGYIIIGLRIDHINQYIKKITNIEKANYIVLDKNLRTILSSESQQSIENLKNKELLTTFISTGYKKLPTPLYFNNIKYSYLNKVPDYPFFILMGYDTSLYRQDFLYKVGTRILEFLFMGIFCLILLYFFRKKIIFPITRLSKLAFLISNGNLNIKIPKQNSIEMFNLARGLLLVIKYIRKTELYKQKLELADRVAKDSDSAKAEFIKKMHYEFGSSLKEIFIYSELICKYFNNNSITNDHQIIQCSKKIQELVMFINTKTSNILELSYFDINSILENAIKINLKNSFSKEIKIITNFQENIPNIYADPLRIKQILISLIRQSIENSPKNSKIVINSSIYLENNCTWFKITIADQSFGLDENVLTEIEEKFNDSSDEDIAIFEFTRMKIEFIEKLVLMHKGKLQIVNKLHEGRNVQLLLPLLSQENYPSKNGVIYFKNQKSNSSVIV